MNVHPPCQDVNTLFANSRKLFLGRKVAPSFPAPYLRSTARVKPASRWNVSYGASCRTHQVATVAPARGFCPGGRTTQHDGAAPKICSPKAERRQSRLASKPSAFCWLSASGIAPVRVWLVMNVHPACQNVNTLFAVLGKSQSPSRLGSIRCPASPSLATSSALPARPRDPTAFIRE